MLLLPLPPVALMLDLHQITHAPMRTYMNYGHDNAQLTLDSYALCLLRCLRRRFFGFLVQR